MNVTVYGPNLRVQGETFHVHKTGCADTERGIYRRLSADQGGWSIDVESKRDVVLDIYDPASFDYDPDTDEYAGYEQDIRFFPCVELPEAGCNNGVHEWGPVTLSRLAGTPHRPCKHCPVITLDLGDE